MNADLECRLDPFGEVADEVFTEITSISWAALFQRVVEVLLRYL